MLYPDTRLEYLLKQQQVQCKLEVSHSFSKCKMCQIKMLTLLITMCQISIESHGVFPQVKLVSEEIICLWHPAILHQGKQHSFTWIMMQTENCFISHNFFPQPRVQSKVHVWPVHMSLVPSEEYCESVVKHCRATYWGDRLVQRCGLASPCCHGSWEGVCMCCLRSYA